MGNEHGAGRAGVATSGAMSIGGAYAEEQPILLSVPAAARALGIGTTLLRELIHRGEVPVVRLGRRMLVRADTLDDLTFLWEEKL